MSAAADRTLSEASLALYNLCNRIMKEADVDITKSAETIAWINANKKAQSTRKTYFCSAIHELKKMDKTDEITAAYDAYRKEVHKYSVSLSEKMKDQKLSESETKKFVDWKTIVAAAEKLYADKSASMEDKLLAAFYTMIPPVRADIGELQIYKNDPMLTTENYVAVRNKDAVLVINNYKNAHVYGAIRSVIPKQLVSMIRAHLKKNPTALKLFPYSAKDLSRKVIKLFNRLTGKKVGINMLRHAYISEFLSTAPSIRDMEALAKRMGHSTALQQLYRRLDGKTGAADDVSTTDSDSE